MPPTPPNVLYYGDNLDVLRRREYFPDASVDLVYLDPPFNSNADYNAFFTEQDGTRAAAQLKAFGDTWRWDQAAAKAFHEFVIDPDVPDRAKSAMVAFEGMLGHGDLLAYVSMLAPRLAELHRVLKPTGSLYLHCDPTASHYIKVLLDAVFGPRQFRNEVAWKRTGAHSDGKQGASRYGRNHDVILHYGCGGRATWNPLHLPYSANYLEDKYDGRDPDGRQWKSSDMTGRGGAARGNPVYEVLGVTRAWGYSQENMRRMIAEGRVHQSGPGKVPRMKQYLDEMPGVPVQDTWIDIPPINSQARERLGYPTQKPAALLERIIQVSSNPGDVVLDPFCGCGTTIAAAHKLGRRWAGIDVTALATTLIKSRLRAEHGDAVDGLYRVVGEPTTAEEAGRLAAEDPWQFQWWALGLVGARPVEKKKGADRGVDGTLYFRHGNPAETQKVIFSVKTSPAVSARDVRDLVGAVDAERAAIGVLLSMHPPTQPMRSAAASAEFFKPARGLAYPRVQLLTVGELLGGKRVEMPSWAEPATFAQPKRAKGRATATPPLPIDGE